MGLTVDKVQRRHKKDGELYPSKWNVGVPDYKTVLTIEKYSIFGKPVIEILEPGIYTRVRFVVQPYLSEDSKKKVQ